VRGGSALREPVGPAADQPADLRLEQRALPNYVAQEQIVFRAGSQKYEAGTHNLLGIVGLVTAMELILELGSRTCAGAAPQTRPAGAALQAKGYTVLQADAPPEAASGIVRSPGRART